MPKNKIKEAFSQIPEKKREIFKGLFDNALFMEGELRKLRKTIKAEGVVEEYQNGANQWGKKKSSEVEVYNAMIKNYSQVMKQINDLLPAEAEKVDEFLDFIK